MKKIAIALFILFALILSLALSKNLIAKHAVIVVCKRITGLEIKVSQLTIGFWNADIKIGDMRLYSPSSYQDRLMMDMPSLFISMDAATLMGGKTPRIKNLDFEIREFVVVRSADGSLNLDSLKPKDNSSAKKSSSPDIHIDKLHMRIGKVIYKDYSKGKEPFQKELILNIDETYKEVSNINALLPLIIKKAVLNTALSNLVQLDMGNLISNLDVTAGDLSSVGLEKFAGFATGVTDSAGGILDMAASFASVGSKDAQSATGDAADKAVSGIKSIVGLFGSKKED